LIDGNHLFFDETHPDRDRVRVDRVDGRRDLEERSGRPYRISPSAL
jgi:hypothetical protein